MEALIDEEQHLVVYIEYINDIPHSVVTVTYFLEGDIWSPHYWDFFPEKGNKKDLRAFESGSGGVFDKIIAPRFAKHGKFWMVEDALFKGKPENAERLKNPLMLYTWYGRSSNPFKVVAIVNSEEYCSKCGYSSEDFCFTHKYLDENGNERWKGNHKYVN